VNYQRSNHDVNEYRAGRCESGRDSKIEMERAATSGTAARIDKSPQSRTSVEGIYIHRNKKRKSIAVQEE
jgi:hypothetical protein